VACNTAYCTHVKPFTLRERHWELRVSWAGSYLVIDVVVAVQSDDRHQHSQQWYGHSTTHSTITFSDGGRTVANDNRVADSSRRLISDGRCTTQTHVADCDDCRHTRHQRLLYFPLNTHTLTRWTHHTRLLLVSVCLSVCHSHSAAQTAADINTALFQAESFLLPKELGENPVGSSLMVEW